MWGKHEINNKLKGMQMQLQIILCHSPASIFCCFRSNLIIHCCKKILQIEKLKFCWKIMLFRTIFSLENCKKIERSFEKEKKMAELLAGTWLNYLVGKGRRIIMNEDFCLPFYFLFRLWVQMMQLYKVIHPWLNHNYFI